MNKKITKLFKKYIVKRPNGNCQVLFALSELDDLVEEIERLMIIQNAETHLEYNKIFTK